MEILDFYHDSCLLIAVYGSLRSRMGVYGDFNHSVIFLFSWLYKFVYWWFYGGLGSFIYYLTRFMGISDFLRVLCLYSCFLWCFIDIFYFWLYTFNPINVLFHNNNSLRYFNIIQTIRNNIILGTQYLIIFGDVLKSEVWKIPVIYSDLYRFENLVVLRRKLLWGIVERDIVVLYLSFKK